MKLGVNAGHGKLKPQLIQLLSDRTVQPGRRDVFQRAAAPQAKRLTRRQHHPVPVSRLGSFPRLRVETIELGQVKLSWLADLDRIARGPPEEPGAHRAEGPAQTGHIRAYRRRRVGRWLVSPQGIRELITGYRPIRRYQQCGHDDPLFSLGDADSRTTGIRYEERSKQSEGSLQARFVHLAPPNDIQP